MLVIEFKSLHAKKLPHLPFRARMSYVRHHCSSSILVNDKVNPLSWHFEYKRVFSDTFYRNAINQDVVW